MRLLIITQKVDRKDGVLGVYHEWIKKFAEKFSSIIVICLYEGEHDLPLNVKVLSLGKEKGNSKIKYLWNFYKYIWRERKNYDAVFVHMNQEYVFLGWKSWWILRKPIYMWRNHPVGSLLTDIATMFCKNVFCTSKFSYTAKYKKTIIMPVGVDVSVYSEQFTVNRKDKSILFLARIAPVKRPDLLIEVLKEINGEFAITIIGDPLPQYEDYYLRLKENSKYLGLKINFKKAIPNSETPTVFGSHEIFVNLSPSGMYDKTIFEAINAGCLVLASNENLRGEVGDDFIFKEGDKEELKMKLQNLLNYNSEEKEKARKELKMFASKHDINILRDKLYQIISEK